MTVNALIDHLAQLTAVTPAVGDMPAMIGDSEFGPQEITEIDVQQVRTVDAAPAPLQVQAVVIS